MHRSSFGLGLAVLAASAGTLASSLQAEESSFEAALAETKPILNMRIRYEGVDQDGIAERADAVTYRIRAGLETGKYLDTSFLVDFELVEDLVDDFNSTTNGNTMFPVVADPQASELNRLQLTNTSLPDTTITLGRQRIILDDARFVGNVGWRQNEQTFDAVRAVNKSIDGLTVDFAYINQVNRLFGDDSPMGRFEGDTYLANVGYKTPFGKLSAFGYFIDVEELGGVPSSQTVGGRFAGKQKVGPGKLGYALSYAHQSDYGSSTLDYDADYYLASADYSAWGFKLGVAYEVLGGDTARGFQTPLGTVHKFQGWADKFLVTPATGVEDLYVTGGYTVGKVGPLEGVKFAAIYHDFSAETTSTDYGSEINLLATAKWEKLKFVLKYADYNSDGFATDTEKVWFQIEFAL